MNLQGFPHMSDVRICRSCSQSSFYLLPSSKDFLH